MKSVLALLHLRPKSRLTMHSTLAACLISGDFALKDGESRTLSVQNKDGTKRPETFMKFRSFITIGAGERVFERPEDAWKQDFDVFVPAKLISDDSNNVFAHLNGLLFLPDASNADDLTRPIIQTILFHRHPAFEPQSRGITNTVSPVVTLCGNVMSAARIYEENHMWRVFEVRSSVLMNGMQKETQIRYVFIYLTNLILLLCLYVTQGFY